jgi:hypothetical protein
MKKLTRTQRVLKYMESHKSINYLEALYECGTSRLAAYIWILKHKQGYKIEKKMADHTNQFGDVEKVANYYLIT